MVPLAKCHRWAYRCTEEGVSLDLTNDILRAYKFCWRSVYKKGPVTSEGHPPLITFVQYLHIDDNLTIYYSTKDGSDDRVLGAYRIETPGTPIPGGLAPALTLVTHPALESALFDGGYDTDPYLAAFTGFLLVPEKFDAPAVAPAFRGRNALVPLQ